MRKCEKHDNINEEMDMRGDDLKNFLAKEFRSSADKMEIDNIRWFQDIK